MKDSVHIGSLILNELRRQGRTNRWLAERINVHPRTINKIFQKSVIDTQQLLHISYALGVDFFEVYSKLLKDTPDMGI
ncbi:MAG: XRE family transcriptional regulator [Bacteroidales bacterium]|nr:XRE family transcriptional regulator [Bacteroidales bacterium]